MFSWTRSQYAAGLSGLRSGRSGVVNRGVSEAPSGTPTAAAPETSVRAVSAHTVAGHVGPGTASV